MLVKHKGPLGISPRGNRPGRDKGKKRPMNDEGGAASRAFGLEEGEGNATWWGGGLATIKATGKETGERYTLVEVLGAEGEEDSLHVHHRENEAF